VPSGPALVEFDRVGVGPLHEVSFAAPPGAVTVVAGPVGSGRTTVARLVAGLLVPRTGRVLFDGVDITDVGAPERARAGIGWVRAQPRPFASLTVAENVLVAASAGERFGGPDAPARAVELLDRLRLGPVAGARPATLTAAELVRLEVAQVLAVPRRLVVVDELGPALAGVERAEVVAALCTTASAGGAVLWLTAPGPLEVDAGHVVLLAGGRVVGAGPAPAVVASVEYRTLAARQVIDR
jgi:branched-chain amino acid transport system ATP-binding protein